MRQLQAQMEALTEAVGVLARGLEGGPMAELRNQHPEQAARCAHDSRLVPVMPDSPAAFTNRELSWLSFARRVLALAEDPEQPLLERVKFAGIIGMIYASSR
jgi:hypothetical protein